MNIEGFINRLGGATRAGGLFDVRHNTVSSWIVRRKIPWRHYLPAKRIGSECGIEIDDSWFEGKPRDKSLMAQDLDG